ncbi:Ig domain-containing protein [Dyadobacter sp. CY312]|uniref:Ig domain-containing protein n=1 Tax=Dyadobacter sp. CY312 TaxID=2907303 RepID=UPI001F30B36E|nr:Ig domain-containing protein [Dyadobacter sp. CY312]MCE7042803.1 Ig domain-containing protein [Dyadobacter sp. CY312]
MSSNVYAQTYEYATMHREAKSDVFGILSNVDNPGYATDASISNNARVWGAIGGWAWLQLIFPGGNKPAGTVTYIKASSDQGLINVFSSLEITARAGATQGSDGTAIAAANVTTTWVIDGAGNQFIRLVSTQPYNSVRIRYNAAFAGEVRVFYARTVSGDFCVVPQYASVESDGFNLGVGLGAQMVYADRAVDNNTNTAMVLNPSGTIVGGGFAGQVSETVYLGKPAVAGDEVVVTLGNSAGLGLGLFAGTTVAAFNGSTPVITATDVSTLFNVNIFGLFTNLDKFTVSVKANATFDRIVITRSGVLDAGFGGGLNVYEFQARKPIIFTGGAFPTGVVSSAYTKQISIDVPGFSIGGACNNIYTYKALPAIAGYTGLPSGLTLAANGTLSGTPAAGTAGSYKFQVAGVNGYGQTAVADFTVVIGTGADLTPVVLMSQPDFSSTNKVRPFTINIYNIASSVSAGPITVYVVKPSPSFSMTFSGTGWTVVDGGGYYTLTNNSAVVQGDFSSAVTIEGTVTMGTGVAKGAYNLGVIIGDGSGGEEDNTNNSGSVSLNVNP